MRTRSAGIQRRRMRKRAKGAAAVAAATIVVTTAAMAYNDGEKDRVYTMFARLRKASEFQEFTRRKSRVFG